MAQGLRGRLLPLILFALLFTMGISQPAQAENFTVTFNGNFVDANCSADDVPYTVVKVWRKRQGLLSPWILVKIVYGIPDTISLDATYGWRNRYYEYRADFDAKLGYSGSVEYFDGSGGDITVTGTIQAYLKQTVKIRITGSGMVSDGSCETTTNVDWQYPLLESRTYTATASTGYYVDRFYDGDNWNDLPGEPGSYSKSYTVNSAKTIRVEFKAKDYTVTVSSSAGGSTNKDGTHTITHGSSFTIDPAADVGYHFSNWTGDAGGAADPLTVTVTGDMNITANFAVNQYTVTVNSVGNGSTNKDGTHTVAHGSSFSVNPTANAGSSFSHWSGDAGGSADPLSVTISSDMSITANFVVNSYTLKYQTDGNGGLSGSTTQNVNHGANASTVTATNSASHTFVNWTNSGGSVVSTNPALTVTNVTASETYTANYALNTYTLKYKTDGNGSLSGTTPQNVSHGGNASTVTAQNSASHTFVNWTSSGGSVVSTTAALTITSVTASETYTANYSLNSYTLNFKTDGNGSLSGTRPQTVNHGNDATTVTANNSASHTFVNWTDSGGTVVSSNAALTITGVSKNETYTANYEINAYTLTFQTDGNGSLTGTTPQTVNHGTDASTITAENSASHTFVNWTNSGGAEVSTNRALTITNVTADETYTANYSLNSYTLTFQTDGNGSLTGTTPQTVDHGNDATTVTAENSASHTFVNWTDSGGAEVSTTAALTITNVSADETYTANYNINSYTLTFQTDGNGSLTGTTPQTIDHNSDASTVTANNSASHTFVNWTDSGGAEVSTSPSLTITSVTADETFTANYNINSYTLTFQTDGNGSLTGTTPQTIDHGSDASLVTAENSASHSFVNWTNSGGSEVSTSAAFTATNVTGDETYTANYSLNVYTVVATQSGNGSVTTSSNNVDHGNGVTITITPETNWSLTGFTVNGTDEMASLAEAGGVYTYVVPSATSDIDAQARFSRDTGGLQVNIDPPQDAGWRLTGQIAFRPSGDISSGIDTGTYFVEFSVPAEYETPDPIEVQINKNSLTQITVLLVEVGAEEVPPNSVLIFISDMPLEDFTPEWRIVDAPEASALSPAKPSSWYESGTRLLNVTPGTYVIEFKTAPGYLKPSLRSFTLEAGESFEALVSYPRPFISDAHDFNGDGAGELPIRSKDNRRAQAGNWTGAAGKNVPMVYDKPVGKVKDIYVPGDFDGDGTAEVAFYRAKTGFFRVPGLFQIKNFGGENAIPVPGDYNGDGLTDAALYDAETATWTIYYWPANETVIFKLGSSEEVPVPANYDGDSAGMTDLATWNVNTGKWTVYTWRAKKATWMKYARGSKTFGQVGDIPVPADYNGDGKADHVVYRPSSNQWIARLKTVMKTVTLGQEGDYPVPADWAGKGLAIPAVFRPVTGEWITVGDVIGHVFGKNGTPLISGVMFF